MRPAPWSVILVSAGLLVTGCAGAAPASPSTSITASAGESTQGATPASPKPAETTAPVREGPASADEWCEAIAAGSKLAEFFDQNAVPIEDTTITTSPIVDDVTNGLLCQAEGWQSTAYELPDEASAKAEYDGSRLPLDNERPITLAGVDGIIHYVEGNATGGGVVFTAQTGTRVMSVALKILGVQPPPDDVLTAQMDKMVAEVATLPIPPR